jgi:hypothetical protein
VRVGPLKYIYQNFPGVSMGRVIVTSVLFYIFDPLAIALILITNRGYFELDGKKTPFEPNLVRL